MLYHTSLQATGYIPSGTTKAKNSYSNGYKAKATLSKHKHKNHSKYHKTEKKSPSEQNVVKCSKVVIIS